MLKKLTWFALFVALSVSCLDEPDCFSLNNNIIHLTFKKLPANAADTLLITGISADATDSIFYQNSEVNSGVLILPLNYLQNSTTFNFTHRDTIEGQVVQLTDEIVFNYNSKVQFVSEDCGERFVISGLSVLETTFDSVRLLNATPFKTAMGTQTNIEIYDEQE